MLSATHIDNGYDTTLVLLHGIFGNRSQLKRFHDVPANILAVDLPGHGKSSSCPYDTILPCMNERLRQTLEHYAVKQHILLGYSLGGFLAVDLLASGWECEAAIVISAGSRLPRMDFVQDYGVLARAQKVLPKHKDLIERAVDMFRKLHEEPFSVRGELDVSEALAFLSALSNKNYARPLQKIDLPVLILHGPNDMLIPPQFGRDLQKHLPNSTLIEPAKTNHASILRSSKTHEEIKSFVEKTHK